MAANEILTAEQEQAKKDAANAAKMARNAARTFIQHKYAEEYAVVLGDEREARGLPREAEGGGRTLAPEVKAERAAAKLTLAELRMALALAEAEVAA